MTQPRSLRQKRTFGIPAVSGRDLLLAGETVGAARERYRGDSVTSWDAVADEVDVSAHVYRSALDLLALLGQAVEAGSA